MEAKLVTSRQARATEALSGFPENNGFAKNSRREVLQIQALTFLFGLPCRVGWRVVVWGSNKLSHAKPFSYL